MEELLKTIGYHIKRRRKELGMTQAQLAQKTGYTSRSSINKIELGQTDLPQSKLVLIAEVLRVTTSYLMGFESKEINTPQQLPSNLHPIQLRRFPMLGRIACGQPIFADEDHESYIDASADIKADFCLTAQGDSMIGARIRDGDVVFIKSQPTVENGQIAAVIINDEATLKRWYYYPDKEKLVLSPENSAYEPLVYVGTELETVTCLGRAVCFMSNV